MSKAEKQAYRQKKRCEKRFERYTQKCPQNIRVDTLYLPIPVEIDSQAIAKSFGVNQDVSGVDSIIARYKVFGDSLGGSNDSLLNLILNSVGGDVIRYIRNRKCLTDSIRFDTVIIVMIDDNSIPVKITIGATQGSADEITPFVLVPRQDLHTEKQVIQEKICPPEFTFKEWAYGMWVNFWWVLVILAVLYLIYKIFGTAIRNIIR